MSDEIIDMTDEVSPLSQPLELVPSTTVEPTEPEVVGMIIEEAQFASEIERQAAAIRLLEAGYTIRVVARKLSMRPSTLWRWAQSEDARDAMEKGRQLRAQKIGQELEHAAECAITTLIDVSADDAVNPRDRVRASEAILDRCGMANVANNDINTVAVAVDIDFDERLARIVAGSRPKEH
jgi:transposase-like protein